MKKEEHYMVRENETMGIHLVEQGKKGIFSTIFSRLGIILVLFLLQLFLLFSLFRWFESFLPEIYGGTFLFSLLMVLYLLNSRLDPTGKITWLIIIMLLPIFGALFYLYTQRDIGHRTLKSRTSKSVEETKDKIPQSRKISDDLHFASPGAASLSRYVARSGCYPVHGSTEVTYFPLGEDKFKEVLFQLEEAKHFIFLEYFIISEGKMWGQILEVLARKAAEGVDVRVLYDGTCEFSTLPSDYPKRLEELGIQCRVFAPITPFVSTHYNNRDHRKILVIDGHTAFNGGVNLADEYINEIEKYGHWKDTAIMLQGDAVRNFTLMFLQMWSLKEKTKEFDYFLAFPTNPRKDAKGFVLPYGDLPLDGEKVGEQVYIDILNRAQKYVYIMTPYLILDGELENALMFAAKRGVDVRIILPGIPDKFTPYALAFTHYGALIDAGVRLYEYTPGFVHAKSFVADHMEAVVGTINLDYRSLYHHFECATYMYGVECIGEIEEDFLKLQSKCKMVTRESMKNEKLTRKVTGIILKAIAPLL